jgi:hypothetical protein
MLPCVSERYAATVAGSSRCLWHLLASDDIVSRYVPIKSGWGHVAAATTLAGVRVPDLSRGLAAPAAARLFAELGADVIKVEMVGGEFTREAVPYVFRSFNRE